MSMELLLALLAFVALDVVVWFWGVDSRPGFYDPRYSRPSR